MFWFKKILKIFRGVGWFFCNVFFENVGPYFFGRGSDFFWFKTNFENLGKFWDFVGFVGLSWAVTISKYNSPWSIICTFIPF